MKPQRFVFFLFVFFAGIQTACWAQRDSIRVRVFSGTQQLPVPEVNRNYDAKNFIRFNMYLILRGAFTVGYERILSNKHSVAIDAGLTYRDFLYESFIGEDFLTDSDTKVGIGNYFEISYKFYPKDYGDFDEAIYISPGFIKRSYDLSTDAEYYNGNDYSTENVDVGYGMTEAYLRFGYLRESWIFDNVFMDAYFGIGYREITANSYELMDSPLGGGAEQVVRNRETEGVPALYAGAKIGFTF